MHTFAMRRGAAVVALLASAGPVLAADLPVVPPPILAVDDSGFVGRLYHAYADEWGLPAWPGPADPNAPPSRRGTDQIAPAPVSQPPYPFTEWPFGASNGIGIATPNAVDSPFMRALSPTAPGKALEDAHIQIYGWVDVGGNVSTAKNYGGNAPVAYAYNPNVVQLDQAVVYIERVPDTVQQDHMDWGFRISPIYGENYRYTTGYGLLSNAYIYHNHYEGFDIPMAYGELYVPYFAEGTTIRVGRYISIPDIEAQLAPNNYMYTHSLAYTYDNYTNTGVATTTRLNKNWMVQFGLSAGTETFPWQATKISLPNGYVGQRDPGTQPSFTACVQWQSDDGSSNIYPCMNSINNGNWGYNNLQWFGSTFYHKFTDKFHVSVESYYEFERNVNNAANTNVVNGTTSVYQGTPWQYMANPPLGAQCGSTLTICPLAKEYGLLAYWNYEFTPLDNISLRTEFYNDENGQRTGFATRYVDIGLGWQHWFSPQVEARPEISWYDSMDQAAFANGTEHHLVFVGGDVIVHF
jgi:hypothetical protein